MCKNNKSIWVSLNICLALTWHWRWQRGPHCPTVLLVATPPAAGSWTGWAPWGPASRCCWSAGTLSRPAASAARCSWNTGTDQTVATLTTAEKHVHVIQRLRAVTRGDSPQERGRRGLGRDRSLDPPRPTHSNCGSDRASPGLLRCSASQQRTAPSSWCRRQTEGKQTEHRSNVTWMVLICTFPWRHCSIVRRFIS